MYFRVKQKLLNLTEIIFNMQFTMNGPRTALLVRVALRKLLKCEGGAGAEGAILPYVGHLQLI